MYHKTSSQLLSEFPLHPLEERLYETYILSPSTFPNKGKAPFVSIAFLYLKTVLFWAIIGFVCQLAAYKKFQLVQPLK
jgi:hypothetical protein